MAVQALSRLNRSADKLGKKTEDLFILDFFNSTEDIKDAFDPFYTSTTLSQATDVNVLHELKEHLGNVGVYEWSEVEDFVQKYFAKVNAQELSPIIDTAAERFNSQRKSRFQDQSKAVRKDLRSDGSHSPLRSTRLGEIILVPEVPDSETRCDGFIQKY